MISINDYDTVFKIDSKQIEKLRSKSGILIDQLNRVSIFFVKVDTTDSRCSLICLKRDSTEEMAGSRDREDMQSMIE